LIINYIIGAKDDQDEGIGENLLLRRDKHNSCSSTIPSCNNIKEHLLMWKNIYKEGSSPGGHHLAPSHQAQDDLQEIC